MFGLSAKVWWIASSVPLAILIAAGLLYAVPALLGSAVWVIADCKCKRPWWRCLAEHARRMAP